jgi:hypothetical protein
MRGLTLGLGFTLTVARAAGPPPIAVRSFGTVTKTADGSTGQTYTAPAGMTGHQWYREAMTIDRTKTLIAGATASTRVAQGEDETYRLGVQGMVNGVLTFAVAHRDVRPPAVVMEPFDSAANWTGWAGQALSVDTVNKVEGTGALVLADTGAQQTVTKNIGVQPDPATWGTVAVLADSGQNALRANRGAIAMLFSNTSSVSGSNSLGSPTNGASNPLRPGRRWGAQHVSRNANVTALGAGTKYIKSLGGVAPFGATVKLDALIRNGGALGTVVLTYDDGFLSQYQNAFPALRSRGLKASVMVPWANIGLDGNRISGRMLIEELKEMYDAGVMAMCLDGTRDDAIMTLGARADPAACVAELLEGKQWLWDHGLAQGALGWGWDAFCYPNGETNDNTPFKQIAALTSDGASNVVAGAAPATAVAVGDTMFGYGIPDGATVIEVTDTTHFKLSVNVPAQTKPAAAKDMRGPFALWKLQTALKAAGFKFGRGTLGGFEYTRMGFEQDQGLTFFGNTTTGQTAAQMIALIQQCQLEGTVCCIYIHNHDDARDLPMFDYMQQEQDAGRLWVATAPELIASDYGQRFPAA